MMDIASIATISSNAFRCSFSVERTAALLLLAPTLERGHIEPQCQDINDFVGQGSRRCRSAAVFCRVQGALVVGIIYLLVP